MSCLAPLFSHVSSPQQSPRFKHPRPSFLTSLPSTDTPSSPLGCPSLYVSPLNSHFTLPLNFFSASAFKLLLIPLILYANWHLLAPYISPGLSNPFAHIFLLSGRVPASSDDDPRYAKTWWDLLFIAYYIVFWSFVRQSLSSRLFKPLARYFGLKKPAKMDRFCEQGYALVYFAAFGSWGYVSLSPNSLLLQTH